MTTFPADFITSFNQFTASDCDRCAFIQNYLSAHGVETALVPVEGKKHIYVRFSEASYSPLFHLKTIIAHYDRAPGSPGANDNSSSVFSLMNFAVQLQNFRGIHNVRIFFTDGEELADGAESVSGMGSYGLANLLKKLGIKNDDVYVFDCTGRGDIPVLAQTILPPGVSENFSKQFTDLENRTKSLIQSVSPYFLTLPVSYSDNAGFLACKIPAAALTMLPSAEASLYMRNVMESKDLETYVRRHRIYSNKNAAADSDVQILKEFEIRKLLPETWQLFHTEHDSLETLTPESFAVTEKILSALALSKTLV